MATKTTTPSPPATLTCSSHCAAVAHPTGGSPIQAAKGPGLRPVRRQGNPIPMSVATACRNGECVAGGRRAQSQSAFIARDERAAATIGCNFHARGPRGRAVHAGARRHDWQQAPLLAKTAGEPIARWDGNRPDCEKLFKIANVPSAAAAALTLGDAATKRLACDDTPDNLKWGKPCNARRWKGDIGGGIRCTRIRCSRIPCSRIPCSRIPVQPNPVQPNPVQPNPVQPNPVQPNPVLPNPVQPNPVQPNLVQPNPVQPNPARDRRPSHHRSLRHRPARRDRCPGKQRHPGRKICRSGQSGGSRSLRKRGGRGRPCEQWVTLDPGPDAAERRANRPRSSLLPVSCRLPSGQ
jgi:hypothetical protein